MNYFEKLPEGCIFKIISKTTPADAVRSTTLSKGFKFIEESDEIWGEFLPIDYQEIIARSRVPPICNTKKELIFSLCDSPIILGKGKLSFFIDKRSGKKCFMIPPKKLIISERGKQQSWQWRKHPNSGFSEVAHLKCVSLLDIRDTIGNQMLPKRTKYVSYLVLKLIEEHEGLEIVNAFLRFVNRASEKEVEERASIVSLVGKKVRRRKCNVKGSQKKVDGWMEIELGNFLNDMGDDGDVEVLLMDQITRLHEKAGLIVQGIEFKPE